MLDPSYAESKEGIDRAFHVRYYDDFEHTWEVTTFQGCKILKNPMDLWTYHEIIHETRPELIIETGTAHGGSALYFACLLDMYPEPSGIVSIDIIGREHFPYRPAHPRLTYMKGSSTDWDIIRAMQRESSGRRTMVVLDSEHRKDHVLRELNLYAPLVTPGQYLVVEDTNVNSRPVCPEHGPGPGEALDEWLPHHNEYQIDRSRERHGLTFNPGGWLKRL